MEQGSFNSNIQSLAASTSGRQLLMPRRCALVTTKRSRNGVRVQAGPGSSGDDYSREFESFKAGKDPEKATQLAAHLNLLWSVSERKRPEVCECCRGSGEKECDWCHGTGAMTVGDTLFCDNQGCRSCPVCRGSGACRCEHCRGTGKRAAWMTPGIARQ